jgi:hypothetical protein
MKNRKSAEKNNWNPRQIKIDNHLIQIVDDHHYALLIWSQYALKKEKSFILVSIDYHPDTNPSFWLYAYQKAIAIDPMREDELVNKYQNKIIKTIDPNKPETLNVVMSNMRNDEQINTAMILGYLKDYHMINCMEKHAYEFGHHYLVPKDYFGSLQDDMFLKSQFRIEEIDDEEIILDIDLDYFLKRDNFNIDLEKDKIFAELVKKAKIITIARSKTYFDYLKREKFSVKECEEKIIFLLKSIISK